MKRVSDAYKEKEYVEAEDWAQILRHKVFSEMGEGNTAIVLRYILPRAGQPPAISNMLQEGFAMCFGETRLCCCEDRCG
jgi:hypothetical protein